MQISQDVLQVLDRATTVGNHLHLNGQLDRKLYEATNKVLVLLGGKWNRSAQAHVFADDAADLVTTAIIAGEVVDAKKQFDAFFTPADLAGRVIAAADIRPDMTVLEPSAGMGALAIPARAAGADVTCAELQLANAAMLRDDGFTVWNGDFLAYEPMGGGFDRVVMNPPFSRQQDVRHVLHAYRFLKPGGRLVAIMSAAVSFRDNALTRDFRDMLRGADGTCDRLPDGSFQASGTAVNTVMVTLPSPLKAEG